jgi:hypothetical protein
MRHKGHTVFVMTTAWDYWGKDKPTTIVPVLLVIDDRDTSSKGTAYDLDGYSYRYDAGYLEWKSDKPIPGAKVRVMRYLIKFLSDHEEKY